MSFAVWFRDVYKKHLKDRKLKDKLQHAYNEGYVCGSKCALLHSQNSDKGITDKAKIIEFVKRQYKDAWGKMGSTGRYHYWEKATKNEIYEFGRFKAIESIRDYLEDNISTVVPAANKHIIPDSISILGEDFNVYKEDDLLFYIEHPKWSLLGVGSTLQEAHRDLLQYIKTTREIFYTLSDNELSTEAQKMKQWLLLISFTKKPLE